MRFKFIFPTQNKDEYNGLLPILLISTDVSYTKTVYFCFKPTLIIFDIPVEIRLIKYTLEEDFSVSLPYIKIKLFIDRDIYYTIKKMIENKKLSEIEFIKERGYDITGFVENCYKEIYPR